MNRTLRVLQVEDSESDAALIVRELERAGYRVESERVETAADMRSALQRRPWDVVIADHHLPGLDAPGALDVLAEAGLDIPFIVVSGAIDEETAVMMMKAGAHDYINKGSLARLAPAVERETREADVRRQRKLLESELQQAQKMEAIGRIAGGVAHDFNNLLTAILGYAALLLDEIPPGDPRRADVEQIRVAGEAAASLTRQLLAFSRKQVLQPRVLDLREVVSGVEQILRRVIAKDIELVTEMPESLGLVCADPGQMQQVLMNLAINARDAMPSGGRLVIAAGDVDSRELPEAEGQLMKPGRYVALSVTDTGCGMADEVKERVFEPFFTTKGHGKGTGLGLSTVYGIVMQSSGHIRADSEQGKGSTFSIYLPAVEGEKPAVEGEKPAVEG
ncbi:MAG: sensor histidine kinase, partial [Vicinamibacterales bacterium]